MGWKTMFDKLDEKYPSKALWIIGFFQVICLVVVLIFSFIERGIEADQVDREHFVTYKSSASVSRYLEDMHHEVSLQTPAHWQYAHYGSSGVRNLTNLRIGFIDPHERDHFLYIYAVQGNAGCDSTHLLNWYTKYVNFDVPFEEIPTTITEFESVNLNFDAPAFSTYFDKYNEHVLLTCVDAWNFALIYNNRLERISPDEYMKRLVDTLLITEISNDG